ncbi:hypothetical protein [Brenneria roseae]|uniref:hypothetical protein n=1 Tax=Brenneria roseae TaxID=1509241 RepID=UPI001FE49818|nr:hypothetical protein [Brenneria roseae]
MKKLIIAVAALMFSTASLAQSYTGYPDISGTAEGYATEVVSYNPTGTFSSTYKVSAI